MNKGRQAVVPSHYHGLLLVDKPEGMTSHDVVGKVRQALGVKSVGHTGTLDPMASGLMVLLIGEATKLSDYLLNGNKGYQLESRLGQTTDTLDRTGEVISTTPVDLSIDRIREAVESLSGELLLSIPKFSAKKIDGKKLYEYARAGEAVEIPKKPMSFFDFKSLEIKPDGVRLELSCSKGSFIRSWSSELGERLSVGATLTSLRRIFSAPYRVEQSIELATLCETVSVAKTSSESEEVFLKELFPQSFIPIVQALPQIHGVTVMGKNARLLRNGQIPHELERRLIAEQKEANRTSKPCWIKALNGESGQLLAILELQPCKPLKTKRIFNIQ